MKLQNYQHKIKNEKLNIACLMYLSAWALVPTFSYYTSSTMFRFLYAAVVLIWFITGIKNTKKSELKDLFSMLLFLVIMFIYYIRGYGNLSLYNFIGYILLFAVGINSNLYASGISCRSLDKIFKFLQLCICLTACTTLFGLHLDCNACRLLTSSSTNEEISIALEKMNIGAFDFIYGLIIVLPVIFSLIKFSKKKSSKVFYILSACISLLCILNANFTTGYVLLILDILLYFVINTTSAKEKFFSIMLFVFILLFGRQLMNSYLNFLAEKTQSIYSREKLESIIAVINGATELESTTSRFELITQDLQQFIAHPFCGVGAWYDSGAEAYIGRHSQFLDELARFGLLTLPLFYFIYKSIIKLYNTFKNTALRSKFLISTIIFLALGFLNPIFNDGILFFYFIVAPIWLRKVMYEDLLYNRCMSE